MTRLAKIASSKNEASLSYALSDNGYPARSLSQEGAIDMAKVALQHAKDEQVRKWAQDVLREQEREITDMRA